MQVIVPLAVLLILVVLLIIPKKQVASGVGQYFTAQTINLVAIATLLFIVSLAY